MFNPMSLEGRRILVTGASSGIGRACAVMASQLGAQVVLVARRTEALEETRQMMARPDAHTCITWDLSEKADIKPLFDEAIQKGKLSGVIYAAGVAPLLPVGILTDEMCDAPFRVNTFSFFQFARYFSKKKYALDGGSFVVIGSTASLAGWLSGTVYCATKGAVVAAVRALALEFAPRRMRINTISPSYIKTEMFDEMQKAFGEKNRHNDPYLLQPLGLGQPEQVASAVCFLLSDAASFITGINLPVDGGYLAQ